MKYMFCFLRRDMMIMMNKGSRNTRKWIAFLPQNPKEVRDCSVEQWLPNHQTGIVDCGRDGRKRGGQLEGWGEGATLLHGKYIGAAGRYICLNHTIRDLHTQFLR